MAVLRTILSSMLLLDVANTTVAVSNRFAVGEFKPADEH
jgi:hypothetical protein